MEGNEQTVSQKRVYKPYKPKLRYKDEIDHPIKGRIAGKCYKSEKLMLEAVEKAYDDRIKRRRRVIRERRILYQLLMRSGLTVEIAFLDVGLKGYYMRYNKVKEMKWRNKKLGKRI